MENLLVELKKILREDQILQNEPMKKHIAFRTGGDADFYLLPEESQLLELMAMLKEKNAAVTVIGNGSNLLVGDKGVRGVVIEIGKSMAEISVSGNKIYAQAGAILSAVASKAYQNCLTGFEFAAGIPGSVGGAMVMNAGAYGGEMKDVVSYVKVLSEEGEILTIAGENMDFSYRHSCVTDKGYTVLGAEFVLQEGSQEDIKAKMDELKEQRVSKQPLEYPSAGSTFKRPEGYFAGKLIMDAGLAGYTVGGASVSEKHCGFVINPNQGTAADVMSVITHVQETVKEQFGVTLETEVKCIGEF